MALIDRVKAEEGFRSHPYNDSRGYLTIGYGFNISPTGPGLAEDECAAVLQMRLTKLAQALALVWPYLAHLDQVRAEVLVDMAYNMGIAGLMGFNRMLAMVEAGNYAGAAAAGLESKWATEVGQRAKDLMAAMETGSW